MDKLFSHRGALWRRLGRAAPDLLRAVSRHGFCPTDLAREPARHRSDSWSQLEQALRNGISPQRSPLYLGRRQRVARLANLVRLGRSTDPTCTKALFGRGLGTRSLNTVYALDATTIDLCLSLFDWAPFRKAKAAVKLHTLLDLRGSIPAFIHISDGKMHCTGFTMKMARLELKEMEPKLRSRVLLAAQVGMSDDEMLRDPIEADEVFGKLIEAAAAKAEKNVAYEGCLPPTLFREKRSVT